MQSGTKGEILQMLSKNFSFKNRCLCAYILCTCLLQMIFDHFSRIDTSSAAAKTTSTMNLKEFERCATDAGLLSGGRLAKMDLRRILGYVQHVRSFIELFLSCA